MAEHDLIANFCSITGATESQARFFLESSGGDLDSAISAFFDHDGEAAVKEGESDVAGARTGGPRPTVTARGALEGGWDEEMDEEMGDEVQQRAPLGGYGRQPPRALGAAGGSALGAGAGAGGRQGGRGERGVGSGQKRGGGGSGARIRTFGDLGRSEEEEEEDDDAQEYYTGGEKR